MQHTTQYQFNLMEGTDKFLPGPLNENMEKVEAALGELGAVVKARAKITIGTYVGTGVYGEDGPVTLDFANPLGTAPKFLFVVDEYGYSRLLLVNGVPRHITHRTDVSSDSTCAITWTETGVSWYNTKSAYYQLNADGHAYHYFAIA